MRLRFLSATAAICAATACGPRAGTVATPAGGAVTPSPAPTAPATSATTPRSTDVVRLGPSALRYVVHQQFHVEQQFQGQTSTIDRGIRLFVAATISGPADSAGYPVTFTVDSIIPDSGSVIPPTLNLVAARGLRYLGHLTSAGEFRQTATSDATLAQTFTQIVGAFRNFYPRIPPGGLTLGAEWTDTSSTSDRAAIDVTVKAIAHSRATTWEQRDGARCLRLEVSSAYSVSGSGDQGGQPLEVTGTGTRSGVQFLAVDGRYLGGEAHDSSSINVGLPMQGMTVPVRQITHSTIAVLP
jgi:hypothetical protein